MSAIKPNMHHIVVSRESEPEAVVIFSCVTRPGMRAEEVLPAVRRAVTEWIKTTKAGDDAWVESSEDFNIGDLAMYLSAVAVFMDVEGLLAVEINPVQRDPDWQYGTLLADRAVLELKTYTTIGYWDDCPAEALSFTVEAVSVAAAIEASERKALANVPGGVKGEFINTFVFAGKPEILSTWAG